MEEVAVGREEPARAACPQASGWEGGNEEERKEGQVQLVLRQVEWSQHLTGTVAVRKEGKEHVAECSSQAEISLQDSLQA